MPIWLLARLALATDPVAGAAASPLPAVVVVDAAARDEGYAVRLDDLLRDDALPIEVAEGERVAIVDPDGGVHPLDVAGGEAWEITGAGGEAWVSTLGADVRTDVLGVRGDRSAIRELAEDLGARILVRDGQTWLVGRDVVLDASWASPDGVDAVFLVPADADPETTRPAPVRPAPIRVAPIRPAQTGIVAAPAAIAPAPRAVPAAAPPTAAVAVAPVPAVPATPATPEIAAAPAPRAARHLDPDDYVGLYLCSDGGGLVLDPSGLFAHPLARGEWSVSAPGVVALTVDGQAWGRAAIETDRHWCRAVWQGGERGPG